MSSTLSLRNFASRSGAAMLNYLHLYFAVIGLVLIFAFAGAAAGSSEITRSIAAALSVPSASAEAPGPAAREAGKARSSLSVAMVAALDHVAQRYRVAPEALQPVFEAIQVAARERNLDPLLIIAVISVESRFNPYSQSSMGAQGLMQIIPRYHQDKLPKSSGPAVVLDPVTNVRVGAQILQEAIRRQGGLVEGLQYYAGAGDDAEQAYANKVMAERQRLEQAARRRDGTG